MFENTETRISRMSGRRIFVHSAMNPIEFSIQFKNLLITGFNESTINFVSRVKLFLIFLSIMMIPPTINAKIRSAKLTAPLSIRSLICGKKFDSTFTASSMALNVIAEKKI